MNICIVNCFDTWEHRVDLLYKFFTEMGHTVKVLVSDYRHIEKCRRTDRKKDYKLFSALPYTRNISIKRLKSHKQTAENIFDFIKKHESRIDLLWVLAPPNIFVKHAGHIKQCYSHIKLVIDLIDLWPESMPVRGIKEIASFTCWKKLRDDFLKYADIIVTECDLYRDVMKKPLRQLTVMTLYLAREDKGYQSELNLPSKEIALCYLGSINNIIDINCIVDIVRQYRTESPVTLHIIGDGEKRSQLIHKIQSTGAKVIYHGKIYDRAQKQKIFDACHYGLNIMKPSVCVGLTMKSIDYLEFGLPIINNIPGDTWNAVEAYNLGMNYKEGMSLQNTLYKPVYRKNARTYFENYLTQAAFSKKLFEIVEILNISQGMMEK